MKHMILFLINICCQSILYFNDKEIFIRHMNHLLMCRLHVLVSPLSTRVAFCFSFTSYLNGSSTSNNNTRLCLGKYFQRCRTSFYISNNSIFEMDVYLHVYFIIQSFCCMNIYSI